MAGRLMHSLVTSARHNPTIGAPTALDDVWHRLVVFQATPKAYVM